MTFKKLIFAPMLLLLPVSGLCAQTAALPEQQAPDKQIFDLTNQDRAAQGLPALTWDAVLADAAHKHAETMAQQGQLSHQYPGEPALVARAGAAGAHFRAIAENIAEGPSPKAIEQEWMHSTPHRTNILDPQMNHIGVAVVEQGSQMYAVEDFSSAVASMDAAQVEQRVGELLRQQKIDHSGPVDDARKDCAMESGNAGASHPLFIMRWEGSDLNRLPSQLIQQLATGRFHTAAVGACASSGQSNQGFTTYRVAVLLY